MKIYTSPVSNFGERVTIATRAKGIEIERATLPAGGLKSPEYLGLNPIAKIPVLVTDEGTVIPESVNVLDYLEDRFPTPSLRPEDPDQRAVMNIAIRVMDTYVMAPVIRCFPHLNPKTRDEAVVRRELAYWQDGLASLAHFMARPLPKAEAGLTLADCVLPPSLALSERIARALGVSEDLLAPHDVLTRYYENIREHPVVGPVIADLLTAQAAYDAAKAAKR